MIEVEKYWLKVKVIVSNEENLESYEELFVREYDEEILRELRKVLRDKEFVMSRKRSINVVRF